MLTVVPDPGCAHVQAFCSKLATGSESRLVDCRPLPGQPFNECLSIVEQQVARHGGQQLTGWAIWEVPGLFIEAEFHAIWQQPSGQLACLTPRPQWFPRILFVPDPARKYAGRQIDNIREPLVRDRDVIRFLYLFRRRFEILNEGDLANQHGPITLGKKALREFEQLEKEMPQLYRRLSKRLEAKSNTARLVNQGLHGGSLPTSTAPEN